MPDKASYSTELGKVLALAGPGLLVIHLIGHALALAPAMALAASSLRTGNRTWIFLGFLASIVYLYPLGLMLIWAMIARLLPKPTLGPVLTSSDALKNIFLVGIYQFARVTPSRGAWSLLPFPGHWFYQICGSRIHPTVFISSPECIPDPHLVEIGANSIIGKDSLLSGHLQPNVTTTTLGRIKIGKNVLIGANSIVFPDVEIGDNSVIYAGSLLRPGTRVPPNEVWAGAPARKIAESSKGATPL